MNGFVLLFAAVLTSSDAQGVSSSPYDLYVSVRTATSLKIGEDEIAALPVGEVLPVLDIEDGWLQTCRVVEGNKQLGWVSVRDVGPSCHPWSRYHVPFGMKGQELAKWREEKRWYQRLSEYVNVSEDGKFTLSRADAVRLARLHSPEYCARQGAFLQVILNSKSDAAEETTAPASTNARSHDEASTAVLLRPWERYRREFCIRVVTGGKAGPRGMGQDFPVAGGPQQFSQHIDQTINEGFLGLLVSQVRIRNLEGNIAGIQDSLYQVEALFKAGQLDDQQSVEQTRQLLYNSQDALLHERNRYDSMLDSYKVTLGLPPNLRVHIEDPLLDQFNLIDSRLIVAQSAVNQLLTLFRDEKTHSVLKIQRYEDLGPLPGLCRSQLALVEGDVNKFQQALPDRIANLQSLAAHPEIATGRIYPEVFSVELLKERPPKLNADLADLKGMMTRTLTEIESIEKLRQADAENHAMMSSESRMIVRGLLTELSDELVVLSLIQARTRLDTPGLTSIDLEVREALAIARANRHDWVEFHAQLTEKMPHETESARIRSWQHSCAVDDENQLQLRRILRNLRTNQVSFELRRAMVHAALLRMDLIRVGLTTPAMPGTRSTTTARDVQGALQALLLAQNDFLATWIDYESLRMSLDLELGTIQLDEHGMWIDPGPVTADGLRE